MNIILKNKYNILYAFFSLLASSITSLFMKSTLLFVLIFILIIGILVLLQILSAKEINQNNDEAIITKNKIGILFDRISHFDKQVFLRISFPLGILFGSILLTILYYLFGHTPSSNKKVLLEYPSGAIEEFWGFIVFNFFPLHYYELFSFFIGILICIILFYFTEFKQIKMFAIGFGIGSASAIIMLDPIRNDIISTLLYTPFFFYSSSLLIMQEFKWLKILSPIFIIILHISTILLINAILTNPNKNLTSYSQNITVYSNGTHEFYYPEPFASPPALEVKFNGFFPDSTKLIVVKQNENYFVIKIESNHYPIDLIYRAQGIKRKIE